MHLPFQLVEEIVADHAGGILKPDGIEIDSAGWFDRDNLHTAGIPVMSVGKLSGKMNTFLLS